MLYDSFRKVQVKGHIEYYIAPFVVVVFNSVQCLVWHPPCVHDYFKYIFFRRCSFVIKRPTSVHFVHGFFGQWGMMKCFELFFFFFFKSDSPKIQLGLAIWFAFCIYAYTSRRAR